MAESRRMTRSEPLAHFAERFGIKRAEAGEFFDELPQLTEQELLRCGEFMLPGDWTSGVSRTSSSWMTWPTRRRAAG